MRYSALISSFHCLGEIPLSFLGRDLQQRGSTGRGVMLEKDAVTELSAVQSWNRKPSQAEILRCELKNQVGNGGKQIPKTGRTEKNC